MGIVDHAKEIAELVRKYNDQDLYERIVTLREEILELREENLRLKEQLKSIEETKSIQSKLIRKGNYYVKEDDPEGKTNIYCLTCWDYEKKLVSLMQGMHGTISCGICVARKKRP